VAVLSAQVSDAHLAGLRADGVSYIFAGQADFDLGLMLETLNEVLGIKRLVIEGGGGVNGAFLRAGLIDQISLLMCPVIDGAQGAPSVFNSGDGDAGLAEILHSIELERSEHLDDGSVWLNYRVQNGRNEADKLQFPEINSRPHAPLQS
jgi:riboflavin biosynthesis pyrimidine reductase